MDLNTAIQRVLRTALAHDGLSRGLHEATRAIERGQAQLCVLAEDCNSPDYKKLIEALCGEHDVNLVSVAEAKQLGQWVGVCVVGGYCCNNGNCCLTHNHLLYLNTTPSRHTAVQD